MVLVDGGGVNVPNRIVCSGCTIAFFLSKDQVVVVAVGVGDSPCLDAVTGDVVFSCHSAGSLSR